jgi:hypothetical protein
MRNYQKLFYQHYYTMLPDGAETEVSRRECFAPGEEPTADNPFIQRWFYDPEASYAIRLPRSPLGESLGKRNAADRKKGERVQENDAKYGGVELDKPLYSGDDGSEVYMELEDTNADVARIYEDLESLGVLIDAFKRLEPSDQLLFRLMGAKAKKAVIAEKMQMTVDGVRYRENRLRKILCSDPSLKDILSFLG